MQPMLKTGLWVVAALAVVVALPVLLRPEESVLSRAAEETLVIVTPHNEATRFEFTHAFVEHYRKETGRQVAIDWRTPGGTSEIARYFASEYLGAFQLYWERTLKRAWNAEVAGAFDQPRVNPEEATLAGEARKAFLESNVSCGIDVFFGGGSYDMIQQAAAGRLVAVKLHNPAFQPGGSVPQERGGEAFWDAKGRWYGAALSSFGICYNVDALARLGIAEPPRAWSDLANPKLRGAVALSDPTQSGSAAKAFEMLVQQQIQKAGGDPEAGWRNGMRLIQRIAANARYFTDSASKVPWDVESGDAAAGMAIDFYGRYQSESVRKPDGTSRMHYITPEGGSSFGADPIALMRGAPSPEVAKAFIEFVLSERGQKLWNWKVGTPDGPVKYALRRLPILPELYAPEFAQYRSDPEVDPYMEEAFVYHPEWTGSLFRTLSFVIQVMAIEPHEELVEAWNALVEAGFPPAALARFEEVERVGYRQAVEVIRPAVHSRNRIEQIRLAKGLTDGFRRQYREVKELARSGK